MNYKVKRSSSKWAGMALLSTLLALLAVVAGLVAEGTVWAYTQWDPVRFERFGGPGGGPRPPIAPFTNEPLPAQKIVVPLVFPVIGASSWRDSYNTNRGSHRHTGIDILAPKMRPVVAPFPGILGFKTQTFWIWGDNGYKCLGTHLNDDTPGTNNNRADRDFMFAPNLRPGDTVRTGQLIGYVGNSGDASGPHLHFELFAAGDPGRNHGNDLFSPFPSLKAAAHITAPRPTLTDPTTSPPAGQARIDGCVREWDPLHRVLTLLLVARQTASGRAFAYITPTRYRLTLPPEIVAESGGSETLGSLPRDRAVTFFVAESPPPKGKGGVSGSVNRGGTALRLVLPVVPPIAEDEKVKS